MSILQFLHYFKKSNFGFYLRFWRKNSNILVSFELARKFNYFDSLNNKQCFKLRHANLSFQQNSNLVTEIGFLSQCVE